MALAVRVVLDGPREAVPAVRDDTGRTFEWAWESIGRIMDKGGVFKSV